MLIDFEMDDQFGDVHKKDDYNGKIVIIVGSDREGSQYNDQWAIKIADSLRQMNMIEEVAFIGVADVSGVPFFMKGIVKGFFPDEPDSDKILMDWDGEFAEHYSFLEDHCNIAIFNTDQQKVYQSAVKEFKQDIFVDLMKTFNDKQTTE